MFQLNLEGLDPLRRSHSDFLRNESAGRSHLTDVDENGSVTVEYLVLVCTVALCCVVSTKLVGPEVVRHFASQVIWISLPYP